MLKGNNYVDFNFFTSKKLHKGSRKMSKEYRSDRNQKVMAEQKFQLMLTALNFKIQ